MPTRHGSLTTAGGELALGGGGAGEGAAAHRCQNAVRRPATQWHRRDDGRRQECDQKGPGRTRLCPSLTHTLIADLSAWSPVAAERAVPCPAPSQDMVDPINGEKLTNEDIIPIARGGTGFAGAGVDLKPKTYTPALQAS